MFLKYKQRETDESGFLLFFFAFFALGGGVLLAPQGLFAARGGKSCVTPVNDLKITADTTLCSGAYVITDTGDDGIIEILADDVTLTCDNTIIRSGGDGSAGGGISVHNRNGVTIQGCRVEDYGTDFSVHDVSDFAMINNTAVFSGPREQEGKGLELGNRGISANVTIRGNHFMGNGNAISYAVNTEPGAMATNVVFEENLVEAKIDGLVIGGADTASEFIVRNNRFTSSKGEILAFHWVKGPSIVEGNIFDTGSNVLTNESQYITMRNNRLLQGASFQIEGAEDSAWDNNYVTGSFSLGRSNEGDHTRSARNLFTNNVVESLWNWTIRMNEGEENRFLNNTLLGANQFSVLFEGVSADNVFRNNIIARYYGSPAIRVEEQAAAGLDLDYNLYYSVEGLLLERGSESYTSLDEWRAATGWDISSLFGNPLFVDEAQSDFHVVLDSPAVNFGDPRATIPARDMDGGARPIFGRYDIGADEAGIPPKIPGVLVVGQVQYLMDGPAASLLVKDRSGNRGDVKYGITLDNGHTWLQEDGTVGETPYYSVSKQRRHKGLEEGRLYEYRVQVTDAEQQFFSELSRCALQLKVRADDSRGNIQRSPTDPLNQYRCTPER